MGGKHSPEAKLLRSMKSRPEIISPIASDHVLPNYGVLKGNLTKTPAKNSDVVNKVYVDDKFPVTHASTTGRTTDDHHNETHAHSSHTGIGIDDHHSENHTITSHNDTSATGSELDTLTDGSDSDSLHIHSTLSTKTTNNINLSVGSGGDYDSLITAIDELPDLINHEVIITILKGTTLTELVTIYNKNGISKNGKIDIVGEKYYPTGTTNIPTADNATATTLRDTSVFSVADEYNDCWIHIVDGTGTDNGFVKINDTDEVNGDIIVSSWPGTMPDNTSKYIIVSSIIDGENSRSYCLFIKTCTLPIKIYGIGFVNSTLHNCFNQNNFNVAYYDCVSYNAVRCGFYFREGFFGNVWRCGIVNNNTSNNAFSAGLCHIGMVKTSFAYSCISDNNIQGIYSNSGGHMASASNSGDLNGLWGSYATLGSNCRHTGTECSGSSGNHTDTNATDNSKAY